jgi:hypothetical protein
VRCGVRAEGAHGVAQRGQLLLEGGEVRGELGIGGARRRRVGTGVGHDLLRSGEVGLDRRCHVGHRGVDLGAEVVVDHLGENAAEEPVVLGQVGLRSAVERTPSAAEQRLEHVSADGVVHHVGEQNVLGGLGAGQEFVSGLTGALQRLHGDDGEHAQRHGTDSDQGRQLHAERPVQPERVRHRGSPEAGSTRWNSTVAANFGASMERLQRKTRKFQNFRDSRSPFGRSAPRAPPARPQRRVETVTVNFGVCRATVVGPTSRDSVGL